MPVTTNKKRITFRLHAPEAHAVHLVGTFNDWDLNARPLKRLKNGNWSITITLEPGTYEYRFVVDGSWVDDPQNEERVPNEFGGRNCLICL